jgi:hypothetical protein
LHDRLPDLPLDPPEPDEREFDELSRDEKIQRLGEQYNWQELAAMYLDALEGK